jgi:hypothetical protein
VEHLQVYTKFLYFKSKFKSSLNKASFATFICTVTTNNMSYVRRSADTQNPQLQTCHIS